MTDQPKRRGRPPKDRNLPVNSPPSPEHVTSRLRWKPTTGFQQAWQHPTGTQWREVPVVAADAPDWDDLVAGPGAEGVVE